MAGQMISLDKKLRISGKGPCGDLEIFESLCPYPCVFVLEKAEGLGKTRRV